MLLELAVGDAYGAGFEYVNRSYITQFNDLSQYVKHPRHRIMPGCYTDDTQMSLAIAEMLVNGVPWTPINLATHFVDAFKRDPREGYAGRFYEFLCNIDSGEQFLEKIIPKSDKSGAAMRAAPLGILATIDEVLEKTRIQAAVTHDTPDGIHAAMAAALMTHYFIYDLGAKKDLGQFLEEHVPGDWAIPWQGKVKAQGWMSVRAAITAVQTYDNLSDMLRGCIDYTGDVDTVATIALAAASCSKEVANNLPEHLILGLENGPFGREYIARLENELMSLAKSHE